MGEQMGDKPRWHECCNNPSARRHDCTLKTPGSDGEIGEGTNRCYSGVAEQYPDDESLPDACEGVLAAGSRVKKIVRRAKICQRPVKHFESR